MDARRAPDVLIELGLPCGKATVRRELNGRLWLGVEDSARPPLRLGDDGEPQFMLCGMPPTHGILAGLAPQGDVAIELPDGNVIAAQRAGPAWILTVEQHRLAAVIETGMLVIRDAAGARDRAVSSLRPFAVRVGTDEEDDT